MHQRAAAIAGACPLVVPASAGENASRERIDRNLINDVMRREESLHLKSSLIKANAFVMAREHTRARPSFHLFLSLSHGA